MHLTHTAPSPSRHAEPVVGIRSLMTHVESAPEALPRLAVAADLAHRLDATLIGLGIEAYPMAHQSERLLPGETELELQKSLDDDLGRACDLFRDRTAGLRAEWRSVITLPGPEIARQSRAADLIVAGGAPAGRRASYRAADTADLVMLTGRPVLVAPPAGGRFYGEAVLVAWKDTREARRALADSLPFLKLAEEVLVVEVCGEDVAAHAEARITDVVAHLRRHGVAARAKVLVGHEDGAAETLQRQAWILDADLIVAGAYGHSRLGEWVFGGVTRDLLCHPRTFTLLSH